MSFEADAGLQCTSAGCLSKCPIPAQSRRDTEHEPPCLGWSTGTPKFELTVFAKTPVKSHASDGSPTCARRFPPDSLSSTLIECR